MRAAASGPGSWWVSVPTRGRSLRTTRKPTGRTVHADITTTPHPLPVAGVSAGNGRRRDRIVRSHDGARARGPGPRRPRALVRGRPGRRGQPRPPRSAPSPRRMASSSSRETPLPGHRAPSRRRRLTVRPVHATRSKFRRGRGTRLVRRGVDLPLLRVRDHELVLAFPDQVGARRGKARGARQGRASHLHCHRITPEVKHRMGLTQCALVQKPRGCEMRLD